MEISQSIPPLKRPTSFEQGSKPFVLEEEKEPFGITVPLPSPFSPHFIFADPQKGIEQATLSFLSLAQKEVLKGFALLKKEGMEITNFSLDFPFKDRQEEIFFEVRYFDTARMEIQLEIQGGQQALENLVPFLPELYQQILAMVYPYELRLILPKSIVQHPEHSVTIKNLCKQHESVYGVNEDEQAP
ncbi:hypothetical protein EB008_02380 [bacterium]|jgi:hypothetical protein|nr:hypothetical protein [bacterium]